MNKCLHLSLKLIWYNGADLVTGVMSEKKKGKQDAGKILLDHFAPWCRLRSSDKIPLDMLGLLCEFPFLEHKIHIF